MKRKANFITPNVTSVEPPPEYQIALLARQLEEAKALIAAKDDEIAEKNAEIADICAEISERDKELSAKSRLITIISQTSRDKDIKIKELITKYHQDSVVGIVANVAKDLGSFDVTNLPHPLDGISDPVSNDSIVDIVTSSSSSTKILLEAMEDLFMRLINIRKPTEGHDRGQSIIRTKSVIRIFVGNLMGVGNESIYNDNFCWHVALNLYHLSHSELLYNILSKILTGYPSGRRMRETIARYDSIVQQSSSNAPDINRSQYMVGVFDNACVNYKPKTSRGGTDNKNVVPIINLRIAVEQGDFDQQGSINVMNQMQNTPKFDRKFNYDLDKPYILLSEATKNSNDTISEVEYLDNEVNGYLKERLEFIIENDIQNHFSSNDVVQAENIVPIVPTVLRQKVCTICLQKFPFSKRVCSRISCRDIPGYKLSIVSEDLHAEEEIDEEEGLSSESKFKQDRADIENILTNRCLIAKPTRNSDGKLEISYSYSSTINAMDSLIPSREVAMDSKEQWIFISGLKPIYDNPSGRKSLKKIYLQMCSDFNVRGQGCDYTKPILEQLSFSTDAGAHIEDIIRNADPGSPLKNLRYILGSGHELMCFNVALLKVLKYCGYGLLGRLHSYKTPGAENFLFGSWDNHKAFDFIMLYVRPAMTDFYLLRSLKMLNLKLTSSNFMENYVNIISHCLNNDQSVKDMHHSNHKFVIFGLIPALAIAKKGTLNNKKVMNDAGRKVILSILPPLGHFTYSRAVLNDIINCYVAVEAVQNYRYKYFSILGQGYDFIMEQTIKQWKTFVGPSSIAGYSVANTLLGLAPNLRSSLNERLGMRERKPPSRNIESYAPEYFAALELLLSSELATGQVPNRIKTLTLDGKNELVADFTPLSIYKTGYTSIESYCSNSDLDNRRLPSKLKMIENKKLIYLYSSIDDIDDDDEEEEQEEE